MINVQEKDTKKRLAYSLTTMELALERVDSINEVYSGYVLSGALKDYEVLPITVMHNGKFLVTVKFTENVPTLLEA